MSLSAIIAVLVLAGVALLLVIYLLTRRWVQNRSIYKYSQSTTGEQVPTADKEKRPDSAENFAADLFEQMKQAVFQRAFDVNCVDYGFDEVHKDIYSAVVTQMPRVVDQPEYFPRKPLILPKLLSALKSDDSSLKELVEIIVQDPVLTVDVLRLANSPFYRISREPIESPGRAVVVLGSEGLRSVVASSIMQPVFKVPPGYFERFSLVVWQLAQHSALAAQAYARKSRACDSFTAHLLGLVYFLSHIVIFRVTVAKYVAAGIEPRAEVFVALIQRYAEQLSEHIAKDWDMPADIRTALGEHRRQVSPEQMSPFGIALYVGRVYGMFSLIGDDLEESENDIHDLLAARGVALDVAQDTWQYINALLSEDSN